MSNNDKLGSLVFNQLGDVVKTELENDGFLGISVLLVLSLALSSTLESLLLLLRSFRGVLLQKLKEIGSLISIQSTGELVDLRRNLESGEEDPLLSLEDDVLGPSDEPGQISLGLDITTNSEVLRLSLKEGIPLLLNLSLTTLLSL